MTRIYLAGAMEAHKDTNYAIHWRDAVKEFMDRYTEDVEIISPTDFYAYGSNLHKHEREIFNFDLNLVRKSDIIFADLHKIRLSVGTIMELKEAVTYGIPVIAFLDEEIPDDEMIQYVHPWVYCCCDRIETGKNALYNACHYIKDYYCR